MLTWAACAVIALLVAPKAGAQDESFEIVHSAVVFTHHGERTPLTVSEQNELTPLGAQQLHSAGSLFRQRYAEPSPSTENDTGTSRQILGLSASTLDNSQLFALAAIDEYISSSAQAFFQGLYPPTNESVRDPFVGSLSALSNGSSISNPLNDYQYPQIETASSIDPNFVWVAGAANCPAYYISGSDYFTTPEFANADSASRDLYESLIPEAGPIADLFPESGFSYLNANLIYDYFNFAYAHNSTLQNSLPESTLIQLRDLASQRAWALNGNISDSSHAPRDRIRAIAGQTLAGKVTGLMRSNIASNGYSEKLNLMFGDFQPFLGFFALSRLVDSSEGDDFYGLPKEGSSMAFELFSIGENTTRYPDDSDLWVRFLVRNGTGEDDELTPYPLFGRGRSQTDMMWTEFRTEMEAISIMFVGDWCDACQSEVNFCAFYGSNNSLNEQPDGPRSRPAQGMKPQVAGVIGAAVTLGVISLLLGAAMLLGGVRFRRSKAKRRSDLGGFKGAEKLASDADLPSGAAETAAADRGHERVGSWELNDNVAPGLRPATPQRAAFPGDERHDPSVDSFADPVKPHDSV
ncbi:MAG: hypothetical protein M1837_005121 [Sclerophora amabilis]|nr:MAG: hypothetical protein M1837_005121 [Sclerophora amabilis]